MLYCLALHLKHCYNGMDVLNIWTIPLPMDCSGVAAPSSPCERGWQYVVALVQTRALYARSRARGVYYLRLRARIRSDNKMRMRGIEELAGRNVCSELSS